MTDRNKHYPIGWMVDDGKIKVFKAELEKVSLWAKYAFWVKDAKFKTTILGKDAIMKLDTEQIKKHHFYFSMMVNFRNQESHRNSLKSGKNKFIKHFIPYDNLLYKMASSLEQIQV